MNPAAREPPTHFVGSATTESRMRARNIEFAFERSVGCTELRTRRLTAPDQFCDFDWFLSWLSHSRSFSNSARVMGNGSGAFDLATRNATRATSKCPPPTMKAACHQLRAGEEAIAPTTPPISKHQAKNRATTPMMTRASFFTPVPMASPDSALIIAIRAEARVAIASFQFVGNPWSGPGRNSSPGGDGEIVSGVSLMEKIRASRRTTRKRPRLGVGLSADRSEGGRKLNYLRVTSPIRKPTPRALRTAFVGFWRM